MKQYLDLVQRILDEGVWVENKRTKTRCLTVINHDLTFDVGKGEFPLVTTRKGYYRQAIGEIIGYIRGFTHISQFHALGVRTWDANSENPVWKESPYYQGEGSLGHIYGATPELLRNVIIKTEYKRPNPNVDFIEAVNHRTDETKIDMFDYIYRQLLERNDDRGLIWSFWQPALAKFGCLRPCMYEHQFSLLGDTLHLNSCQRSADTLIGTVFNMPQVYFLLWVMAQITGLKPGKANLKIVNAHIYENQLPFVEEQLKREPYPSPKLIYTGEEPITYESLIGDDSIDSERWLHPRDFKVEGYQHHPAIQYPFTV